MDIKKLSDSVSVAGQVTAADIPGIAASGFRALICNRPDGEGPGQPGFAEIEAAAQQHGLATAYVPVVGGFMTEEDVAEFAAALEDLPGPVLAYCRSGARSANIWAAAQAVRGKG